MPVCEIVVRSCQETTKRLDRIAATRASAPTFRTMPWNGLAISSPGGPLHAASGPLAYLHELVMPRFFEGAGGSEARAVLKEQLPQTCDRIIAAAEAICQGRFDLLGYRGLTFGDPVDWHLDPVSGRRAPLIHWSLLDPLNEVVVGDSKVVWELNRHQWLVWLGQAYRLTGDEKYAEVFARSVREWLSANPVGLGINWASSLEVAFRLISWCWALALFEGSRVLTPVLLTGLLEGIEAHARHVSRYLSWYFSPNTHLTGEALGLVYAGILFPELRAAGRWRRLGARILVEQSERQILADGIYFEQSSYYQRYTAEIYLHFLLLADRGGIRVPSALAARLQKALDFLLALRRPDGSMPQVGDADSGWLLPFVPRAPDDLRGVFSVAAAVFGRSDYAWAAGGISPELVWLLGPAGVEKFVALTPTPPQDSLSRAFPHGGYVVMRNGWAPDAHQLIFDVGPLSSPVVASHAHADLLSIQCAAFGEPFLIDAGTGTYTAHPEWREFFRSTASHSTLRVDGLDQAVPAGPFKWQARPEARLYRWLTTDTFDFADAAHDAYAGRAGSVRHRRRVLFIKPRYWLIADDLYGSGEHHAELRFQFAPIDVTLDSTLRARARGGAGKGLLIMPFASAPLRASIRRGTDAPTEGWISPEYGQRYPAPVLIYETAARLPLRIVSLLLPLPDVMASSPVVAPAIGRDGLPVGVAFEDGECVCFSDLGPPVITQVEAEKSCESARAAREVPALLRARVSSPGHTSHSVETSHER